MKDYATPSTANFRVAMLSKQVQKKEEKTMIGRLLLRLRAAGSHLRVAWCAWRHPKLPLAGRLMLIGMAIYVISPIDFIPDALPVLGWLDDLALISLILPLLLKLLPQEVIAEARRRSEGR